MLHSRNVRSRPSRSRSSLYRPSLSSLCLRSYALCIPNSVWRKAGQVVGVGRQSCSNWIAMTCLPAISQCPPRSSHLVHGLHSLKLRKELPLRSAQSSLSEQTAASLPTLSIILFVLQQDALARLNRSTSICLVLSSLQTWL